MPDQEDTQTQDLHLTTLAKPDENWSRMQPMFVQPSKERLDRKHQLVQVKNTSDTVITSRGLPVPQKHIVIDRFNQGHELEAGQQKEIDMLVDDIEYFVRERLPNRKDHLNRAKPQHPIQILGVTERDLPQPEQSQQEQPPPNRVSRERSAKSE